MLLNVQEARPGSTMNTFTRTKVILIFITEFIMLTTLSDSSIDVSKLELLNKLHATFGGDNSNWGTCNTGNR